MKLRIVIVSNDPDEFHFEVWDTNGWALVEGDGFYYREAAVKDAIAFKKAMALATLETDVNAEIS